MPYLGAPDPGMGVAFGPREGGEVGRVRRARSGVGTDDDAGATGQVELHRHADLGDETLDVALLQERRVLGGQGRCHRARPLFSFYGETSGDERAEIRRALSPMAGHPNHAHIHDHDRDRHEQRHKRNSPNRRRPSLPLRPPQPGERQWSPHGRVPPRRRARPGGVLWG